MYVCMYVQSHHSFWMAPLACFTGSFCRSGFLIITLLTQLYRLWRLLICMYSSSRSAVITGSLWTSPSTSHCPKGARLPRLRGTRRMWLPAFFWVLFDLPCYVYGVDFCLGVPCTPAPRMLACCKLALRTAPCWGYWRLAVVFSACLLPAYGCWRRTLRPARL